MTPSLSPGHGVPRLLTFSSVRPRTSVWKPSLRAWRIRMVLTFTWMR